MKSKIIILSDAQIIPISNKKSKLKPEFCKIIGRFMIFFDYPK